MEHIQSFSFSKQVLSFVYAFRGIRKFIVRERNAKWHLVATLAVVGAAFFFKISSTEAIALTLVIGFVWMSEIFNTCLEKLIDFISLEQMPVLGYIKDMAAGAVLVSAICSVIVAFFIFLPKII
jgi:diacylglycerol kinase (ATP)